jgi:hypothetical protein
MLLGSAPLLVRQGLTDSLAGRFEIIRVGHWSFAEMRDAFGWDLDRYIEAWGGHPAARVEPRWSGGGGYRYRPHRGGVGAGEDLLEHRAAERLLGHVSNLTQDAE